MSIRATSTSRPFWYKLIAAVTTVGFGGSAALEGPSIYGGGAIGSWLWTRLKRLGLESSRATGVSC